MNKIIIFICILLLNSFLVKSNSYKYDFYVAFSLNDTILINNQLKVISNSKYSEKKAFIGALLMKKAGLVSSLKDKLSLFRKGKQLLEESILNEKQNAEYRFLRIVIQENCPSILMYNKNIEEDKKIIIYSYNKMDVAVKNAIFDYSKTSKTLNIKYF